MIFVKKVVALFLIILLVSPVTSYAQDTIDTPFIEKGILYYKDKQVNLSVYEFVNGAPGDLIVPNKSFNSALYYKPALMGNYIYLIAAVFIENSVSLMDSFNPEDASTMGDVYNILIRIPIETMEPGMIAWQKVKTLKGFRWTFEINEGISDYMGAEQEVYYAWGKEVLIPQLIKSKYHPGIMYAVFECYDPVLNKMVFHFGWYTKDELESNRGACKQLFYLNYTHPTFADREHGACYYEEIGKNSILVRYFPKDYKGDVYDYVLDISEYTKPRVSKSTKFPMPEK